MDRRRREYVPGEGHEQPDAQQQPVGAPGEDVQLALDTLERRIAHLSTLLNPPPGTRPHRTAHWRDEVELRSLRLSVKALRKYHQQDEAVGMLGTVHDQLLQLMESGALPVRQHEAVDRLAQLVDQLLERLT